MGASQTCATRSRGRARFTHMPPTLQISEDTPPISGANGGISSAETRPALRSRRKTGSGREALNLPGGAVSLVEQPVVQAIAATLPELDLVRLDAVAAPVRWPRRLLAVALPGRLHGEVKNRARSDKLTLR